MKPSMGYGIDWGHPIAHELSFAWLMNERSGENGIDLTQRIPITINSSRGVWGNDLRGRFIRSIGGGTAPDGSAVTVTRSTPSIPTMRTVALWFLRETNNQSSSSAPILFRYIIDANNRVLVCPLPTGHIAGNDSIWIQAVGNGSSVQRVTPNDSILPLSKLFFLVCEFEAGTTAGGSVRAIYLNGISQSLSISAVTNGTTTPMTLQFGGGSSSNYYQGTIGPIYVWNRYLTSPEVMQLYDEPYAFIRPSVRNAFVTQDAPAPTTKLVGAYRTRKWV